jgi:plastocyanin
MRVLTVALFAALVLSVASAGAMTAAPVKLVATVGPGVNITLTKGGAKVSSLPAGSYTVTVRDRSNEHNFHLMGPGTNKTSSVGAEGTSSWKLTLKKGSYRFVCDPHATFMKGAFKVR